MIGTEQIYLLLHQLEFIEIILIADYICGDKHKPYKVGIMYPLGNFISSDGRSILIKNIIVNWIYAPINYSILTGALIIYLVINSWLYQSDP